MADRATTSVTAASVKAVALLKADAERSARASFRQVDGLANLLAEIMQEIHGDTFRIQVDHENGFVAVVRRSGGRRR